MGVHRVLGRGRFALCPTPSIAVLISIPLDMGAGTLLIRRRSWRSKLSRTDSHRRCPLLVPLVSVSTRAFIAAGRILVSTLVPNPGSPGSIYRHLTVSAFGQQVDFGNGGLRSMQILED
jgi:hypothetical protein